MAITRRGVLTVGAVLVAYGGWRVLPAFTGPRLDFEALEDPRGFRRIAGGPVSTNAAPFLGISAIGAAGPDAAEAESAVAADLCGALFGGRDFSAGTVPIASFSDYYCPYCRVQTRLLTRIEAESGGTVRVVWHELPLLGDSSRLAAKAALAARRQDAYAAFHARMMRAAFQATPGYLEALAASIDLDPARLAADMESPEIARELAISAALARRFGFFGTPALVIGKTAALGEIAENVGLRLIELERAEGMGPACAAT